MRRWIPSDPLSQDVEMVGNFDWYADVYFIRGVWYGYTVVEGRGVGDASFTSRAQGQRAMQAQLYWRERDVYTDKASAMRWLQSSLYRMTYDA